MTDNQTVERPLQSIDLTKAELQLALSKEGLAYQTLLQECENVTFTRDNLNDERTALVSLRKVKSKLEAAKNPYTEKWAAWNSARKSLVDPVVELLTKKEGEYKKIAAELAEEARKAEAEKQRKAGILSEIDNFFIAQSQAIAAATTPEELVRIEKLIGSHKANAARYGEYLPLMAEKAANLTDLIKSQKEALRKLEALKTAEKAAEATGDDQAVLDSREAQEQVAAQIEEKRTTVQEVSISMATASEITEVEVIAPTAPKPRRTSWKFEVTDIKAAQKAGLTVTLVDENKVSELLAEKRKTDNECTENGIRYYKHYDY